MLIVSVAIWLSETIITSHVWRNLALHQSPVEEQIIVERNDSVEVRQEALAGSIGCVRDVVGQVGMTPSVAGLGGRLDVPDEDA